MYNRNENTSSSFETWKVLFSKVNNEKRLKIKLYQVYIPNIR